jgi:hypothetical protein
MQLVKSFKEYCKVTGYDGRALSNSFKTVPSSMRKALLATAQLYLLTKYLNDDWKPDWNNRSEYKWFPFFLMNKQGASGFRFLDSCYGDAGTCAGGSSRLCYKSEALADHSGKYFADLWEAQMVVK